MHASLSRAPAQLRVCGVLLCWFALGCAATVSPHNHGSLCLRNRLAHGLSSSELWVCFLNPGGIDLLSPYDEPGFLVCRVGICNPLLCHFIHPLIAQHRPHRWSSTYIYIYIYSRALRATWQSECVGVWVYGCLLQSWVCAVLLVLGWIHRNALMGPSAWVHACRFLTPGS